MPSTHTRLPHHLVFATRNRAPIIAAPWRGEFHYLGGINKGLEALPQGIGGVAGHVHLLASLKPTQCLSDFMRELKKSSSSWIRETHVPAFHWQEGYSAVTVSASARDAVKNHIACQEQHHRSKSVREELIDFLEKPGVAFGERYLD